MEQFLSQYKVLKKKGLVDYNAAKILYNSYSEGNTELEIEVIAFHLQQCAEKMIKAILAYRDIDFIKTHDIELLLKLVSVNISDNIEQDLLIELNDFSVEGRYSVIHDDIENIDIYFKVIEDLIIEVNTIIK